MWGPNRLSLRLHLHTFGFCDIFREQIYRLYQLYVKAIGQHNEEKETYYRVTTGNDSDHNPCILQYHIAILLAKKLNRGHIHSSYRVAAKIFNVSGVGGCVRNGVLDVAQFNDFERGCG